MNLRVILDKYFVETKNGEIIEVFDLCWSDSKEPYYREVCHKLNLLNNTVSSKTDLSRDYLKPLWNITKIIQNPFEYYFLRIPNLKIVPKNVKVSSNMPYSKFHIKHVVELEDVIQIWHEKW